MKMTCIKTLVFLLTLVLSPIAPAHATSKKEKCLKKVKKRCKAKAKKYKLELFSRFDEKRR